MAELEKVIRGLECLSNPYVQDMDERDCENCQYDNACCFLDATADALSLLKAQEPGWISVKDRLPDQAGYECLVCAVNENYNQTHVFTASTGYGEPGWWTGNVHYMARVKSPQDNRVHPALKITHWLPLPEPPKEET